MEGYGVEYSKHILQQQIVNGVIDEVAAQDEGVSVLDATEILCEGHKNCRVESNGFSLYRDGDHLSPEGAIYIRAMMEPITAYLHDH